MTDPMLTTRDVATLLMMPEKKVRRMSIPFHQEGRSRLYARSDLEAAGLVAKPDVPTSWVYFIGHGKLVKIGTARNVKKRLGALQCGSPVPLKVLCAIPGDRRLEADLHERWHEYRKEGEWFFLAQEILKFITNPNNRAEAKRGLRDLENSK